MKKIYSLWKECRIIACPRCNGQKKIVSIYTDNVHITMCEYCNTKGFINSIDLARNNLILYLNEKNLNLLKVREFKDYEFEIWCKEILEEIKKKNKKNMIEKVKLFFCR